VILAVIGTVVTLMLKRRPPIGPDIDTPATRLQRVR
jgi:hypothetical protein